MAEQRKRAPKGSIVSRTTVEHTKASREALRFLKRAWKTTEQGAQRRALEEQAAAEKAKTAKGGES